MPDVPMDGMLTVMRPKAIQLIMKYFSVTFTLTIMRGRATPLKMKVFTVTFTLTPFLHSDSYVRP